MASLAIFTLSLRQFENSAFALRQGPVDLINDEVFEFPRAISLRLWNAIKAIPLLVKLLRKFRFVVSRLFAHVELKCGNDLFFRGIISRKRVNQTFDSSFCGGVENDV